MASELKPWKYEIKYGPEGEDAYSWVYDDHGAMVATMKTHKAREVVDRMNTPVAPVSPDATGKFEELVTVAWNCTYPSYGHFTLKEHEAKQATEDGASVEELVTRSQAVELLAEAERRNSELERELTGVRNSYFEEKKARLADNAALTARVKELERALETEKTLSRGDWACQRDVDQMSIKLEALEAKLAAANEVAQLVIQAEEDKSGDPNFYILLMQTAYDKARAALGGKPSSTSIPTQKTFEVYGPYTPVWIGAGVWAGIKEELPPQLVDKEVWISTADPSEVQS